MYISPLYYSFIAFGFASLQIFLVNLWLIKYEPAEVLASFNYSYLIVIVGSQIATWGVHYSVLHKVGLARDKTRQYVLSAIVLVLSISIFVSFIVFCLLNFFKPEPILNALPENIMLITLCLVVVPMNKVLMAYLNAIKKMYLFSSVYLVRAMGLLAGVIIFSVMDAGGSVFRSVFFAELFTTLLLVFAYNKYEAYSIKGKRYKFNRDDIVDHFEFGKFSVWGGLALESNVRIDGFYVSIFCSVEQFSKYSFLSIMFEGVQQFHAIIRNFVNVKVNDYTEVSRKSLKEYMKYSFLFGAFLFFFVLILFEPVVRIIDIPLLDMFFPTMLLSSAILVSSAFLPFDQVANQKGRPNVFFRMSISVLFINIFFNSIFVPFFGVIGAAFSTFLAYTVYALLIFKSTKVFGVFKKH